jgi:DNA-binding NtrC family response regulator
LKKTLRSLKQKIEGFTPEALDAIRSFSWPGNIRQLANTIERAAILEETLWIQSENILLPEFTHVKPPEESPIPAAQSLDHQEKEIIIRALEESLWVQKEAANRLAITPRALNYKIKKYGITHDRWRKHR